MTASVASHFNEKQAVAKALPDLMTVRQDPRYARIDELLQKLARTDEVVFDIQVDGSRHRLEWPVDFSGYRVIASTYPVSLELSGRGHFPELEKLRSHMLQGDFDLLTYFTCSTDSPLYLQNSQNRMDWFFALDSFVDGPSVPPELREEVVCDLSTWLDDRRHVSRLPWVNMISALLRIVLEDIEREGLDTSLIVREIRGYYEGFLLEFDQKVSLQRYLENRSMTIGMRPELEFCFAYLDRPRPAHERDVAERMKHAAADLVALQNDVLSLCKEEAQEQEHLRLKSYFPVSHDYVSFVNDFYRARFGDFLAMRPRSPGTLEELWKMCAQWISGSLLWHLTSRRYNLGQFEILA
ncbi:terpene synthase family protein [Vitiosangium sp. GDMCC 1.1324]|uniref:terpene synthase family protein n=1 Tax=Vitiosangium sp. (strain GDMCC 1.1324) TaxID=2138576 RepID=UPI0018EE93D3|nr:terpene synthase family protein [Vitiosangium sp. GDMCC 1.1324]